MDGQLKGRRDRRAAAVGRAQADGKRADVTSARRSRERPAGGVEAQPARQRCAVGERRRRNQHVTRVRVGEASGEIEREAAAGVDNLAAAGGSDEGQAIDGGRCGGSDVVGMPAAAICEDDRLHCAAGLPISADRHAITRTAQRQQQVVAVAAHDQVDG